MPSNRPAMEDIIVSMRGMVPNKTTLFFCHYRYLLFRLVKPKICQPITMTEYDLLMVGFYQFLKSNIKLGNPEKIDGWQLQLLFRFIVYVKMDYRARIDYIF